MPSEFIEGLFFIVFFFLVLSFLMFVGWVIKKARAMLKPEKSKHPYFVEEDQRFIN